MGLCCGGQRGQLVEVHPHPAFGRQALEGTPSVDYRAFSGGA